MIQIGPLVIDFTPLLEIAGRNPLATFWFIFIKGGWIVVLIVFARGLWWIWADHIVGKVKSRWQWVLLSIDVPRENIQSPRAVENIFAHLAGAHKSADLVEKYITGFAQPYFSFEIVSINGFIRFFISTEKRNRDLVEAAIYAQYPTAEIVEAQDYAAQAPTHFPNPEWQLWGTEFILTKPYPYPIRTYPEFQDETAEESAFKDPMAALLETMSGLRDGEQLWLQIIVTPIKSGSWQEKSLKLVQKIAGIAAEKHSTLFDKLIDLPGNLLTFVVDLFLPGTPAADNKAKNELPSKMLYLTSGERATIEAIERKASKIGFKTKIRTIYIAHKDVYLKARAAYGIVGAMKQVNTEDLNSLKPDYKKVGTKTKYIWTTARTNWRRVKIMRAYKARSNWKGFHGYILNIEELATLWHFPVAEAVKTPLLKKAESKRGEPPIELPVEFPREFAPINETASLPASSPTAQKSTPEEAGTPKNLPTG